METKRGRQSRAAVQYCTMTSLFVQPLLQKHKFVVDGAQIILSVLEPFHLIVL